MRVHPTAFRCATACGAALLAIACGHDGPTELLSASATLAIESGAPTLTAIGDSVSLLATIRDRDGNPLSSVPITWQSSMPEVASVTAGGIVVAKGNGTALITARAGAASDTTTVTVAQHVARIVFRTQPESQLAGRELPRPIVVVLQDERGTPVTKAPAGPVTLTLGPVGILAGTTTVTPVNGVATFTGLAVPEPGHAYWLRASAGDLPPAVSSVFDVYIPFVSVSAGHVHTCGLAADGVAYCWGDNAEGRVGDGSTTTRSLPVRVAGDQRFMAVHAGAPGTWALTPEGKTFRWGGGFTVPTAFASDYTFASLSTHWATCGLTPAGLGYCWGDLVWGSDDPTLVFDGRALTALETGEDNGCGIATDGTIWCVGNNPSGELGNGTTAYTSTPTAVVGGFRFAMLGMGEEHACGLTTDGLTYCWGRNQYQQLGDSVAGAQSSVPVAVAGGHHFTTISVGAWHACGLEAGGTAYCWGDNRYGMLGTGSQLAWSATPDPVAGGHTFVAISAGGYHTCGITTEGFTYCWGFNVSGALGTGGTPLSASTPVLVAGPALPTGGASAVARSAASAQPGLRLERAPSSARPNSAATRAATIAG